MNELQATEYVKHENNQVKTTSRIVAEKFGKRHADVIRVVKSLSGRGVCNFTPTTYEDSQGKSQVEFEMDRKAYMLLAMRFTGDEALKIQVAFIDAFEAMAKRILAAEFTLGEKAQIFPVAAEAFRSLTSVAQVFGLEKNQALLYANKATKRETGVDFQNVLQIELKNKDQERCFTPTDLGHRIGMSAMKFNRMLESAGLQEKRNQIWCATEIGKTYSVLLDAGKKHSDGTPIQQLKWKEDVLELIQKKVA